MRYGILMLLMIVSHANAATWYAASNGSETNGTSTQPWGVPYALGMTANPYVKAGDTVLFKAGTYICTNSSSEWTESNIVNFAASGTMGNPITYRSEKLWQFSFDGGLIVPYASSNITIRDFNVFYHGMTNRSRAAPLTEWDMPAGLMIGGSNVVVMHNIFGNTGHPAVGWWHLGGPIYLGGNISRFPGYNDSVSSTFGHRGSGGYYQQQWGSHVVEGGIGYYCYTEPQYSSESQDTFTYRHNAAYQCFQFGLNYESKHYATNTLYYQSNYTFMVETIGTIGASVGVAGYVANETNLMAHIEGNYIVGSEKGLSLEAWWQNAVVTNNVIMRLGDYGDGGSSFPTEYRVFDLESFVPVLPAPPVYTIGNNAYYSVANTSHEFLMWGTNYNFSGWQTASGDSGSTFSTTLPNTVVSKVFRPSTDPDFVHVVVFNWPTNATTTVDISPYFNANSALSIYDAQNAPVAYTNFTYTGGSVSLDLSLTNCATMLGTYPDITTPWAGFEPRFRVFIVHKDGDVSTARVKNARAGGVKGK